MTEKTAILFQLGPVTDHHQWADYLQYGFDAADVPELLRLASDESLHHADCVSQMKPSTDSRRKLPPIPGEAFH
jgi:hypothetical protein